MQDTFVISQVQTFALTVGLGVLIGFSYDVLRAVKKLARPSRRLLFFTDLLFWVAMTVIVFFSLLSSNWGEVRAYVFIGLATGGLLYTLALSKAVYRLLVSLMTAVIRLVRTVTRPLVWVAIRAGGGARRIWRFVLRLENAVMRRAGNKLRKIPQKFNRKKKE